MKILILDDDAKRHMGFNIKLRGHEVHHAKTTAEAGSLIRNHVFHALFLDHDLEEYRPGAYGEIETTGYDFCGWLVRYMGSNEKKPEIVVHSFNTVGAMNMGNLLRANGFRVTLEPYCPPK